jgi:hypothetical protein
VEVLAEYRTDGTGDWRPAGVWPHVSDTAIELMRPEDWNAGIREGRLTERRAAGLRRTLIWNPAKLGAGSCGGVWITVSDQGRKLLVAEARINVDNSDVVLLNDWSKVVQQSAVSENPAPGAHTWWLRRGASGTTLEVKEKGVELPALTYPLDLHGCTRCMFRLRRSWAPSSCG